MWCTTRWRRWAGSGQAGQEQDDEHQRKQVTVRGPSGPEPAQGRSIRPACGAPPAGDGGRARAKQDRSRTMSINENRSVVCKECGSHAVWVEDGFSATTYEGLHIGQPECECQCECEGTLVVTDEDEQPALWFQPNDFPVDVIEVRGAFGSRDLRYWSG